MKKNKIKNEILYTLVSDLPFAGKGMTKTAKEWKRIYGYEIGFPNIGSKFVKCLEDKREEVLTDILKNTK